MTYWNRSQAELLLDLYRRAPMAETDCHGPSLAALIDAGFAMIVSGKVVVTLPGKARALELLRSFA